MSDPLEFEKINDQTFTVKICFREYGRIVDCGWGQIWAYVPDPKCHPLTESLLEQLLMQLRKLNK